MTKQAVIKLITKGKHKGEFTFFLEAENGETIAQSYPESYTQKHNVIEILESSFSDFDIVDRSIPKVKRVKRVYNNENKKKDIDLQDDEQSSSTSPIPPIPPIEEDRLAEWT